MEHSAAWSKVALAWVGLAIGAITLQQIASVLTIALTVVTLYTQLRAIWRQRRLEKLEAKLLHKDLVEQALNHKDGAS